jgi:hypothetical protein
MKKYIILLSLTFSLSGQAQNTKITVLKEFISDIIDFGDKKINETQPIINISELAHVSAEETIEITYENIELALIEAKSFRHCLIIVEHHTVIRIIDNDDCNPSFSWKTCMPLSSAYIQRSGLLYEKKDYLKNLIGRPDSQIRTMYLFN